MDECDAILLLAGLAVNTSGYAHAVQRYAEADLRKSRSKARSTADWGERPSSKKGPRIPIDVAIIDVVT